MKKKIERHHLDWDNYLRLIDNLHEKIQWNKERFSVILSINRGGNIIGTILSHKTGIPLKVINKESMIYETEKFLVVDDIADTGSTLQHINYMSQGVNFKNNPLGYSNKAFKTATLFYRDGSKVAPDYWVSMTDKWIVFPYEKE